MFGFLNVNKPAGPTSHDIVAAVRRLPGRRVKVGHAGTLDPFASGVLVLCVGQATRLAQYVQNSTKRYTATVTLGATSTTDDIEGELTTTPDARDVPANAVSPKKLPNALARFVGVIEQVPPAHCAVHVAGQRAYTLARQGKRPKLTAREVTIQAIELLRYEYPQLDIDVTCSCGTYIRALARDIGTVLGVGGYCSALTRTQVGPFVLGAAVAPEDIDPARDLLDPLVGLEPLAKITLAGEAAGRLMMGQAVALADAANTNRDCAGIQISAGEVAVLNDAGRLIAIATLSDDDAQAIRPAKVFPAQ